MLKSCGPAGARRLASCLVALMLVAPASHAQNAIDFVPGAGGQITFTMPSHNVECIFTPAGGTDTYKPFDGGPELSCDRRDPKYVRFVLTPKSLRRFDDVGDQGCCGTENPFRYDAHWSKGPFACDSTESASVQAWRWPRLCHHQLRKGGLVLSS